MQESELKYGHLITNDASWDETIRANTAGTTANNGGIPPVHLQQQPHGTMRTSTAGQKKSTTWGNRANSPARGGTVDSTAAAPASALIQLNNEIDRLNRELKTGGPDLNRGGVNEVQVRAFTANYDGDVERLKKELHECEVSKVELRQQRDDAERRMRELEEERDTYVIIEKRNQELEAKHADTAELEGTVSLLRSRVSTLEADLNSVEDFKRRSGETEQLWKNKVTELRDELGQMQQERDQILGDKRHVETELEILKASARPQSSSPSRDDSTARLEAELREALSKLRIAEAAAAAATERSDVHVSESAVRYVERKGVDNTAEIERYQQRCNDAENALAVASERIQALQSELSKQNNNAETAQAELDAVQRELANLRYEHGNSTTQVEEFTEEVKNWKEKYMQLKRDVEEKENELDAAETAKRSFEQKVTTAHSQAELTEGRLSQVEKERDEAQATMAEYRSEAEKHDADHTQTKQQLAALSQEYELVRTQLKQVFEQAGKDSENMRLQLDKVFFESRSAQEDREALLGERTKLQQELAYVTNTLNETKHVLERTETTAMQSQAQLEHEMQSLRTSTEGQLRSWADTRAQLQRELDQLRSSADTLRYKEQATASELNNAESNRQLTIHQYENTIGQYKAQLDAKQRELDQIKLSYGVRDTGAPATPFYPPSPAAVHSQPAARGFSPPPPPHQHPAAVPQHPAAVPAGGSSGGSVVYNGPTSAPSIHNIPKPVVISPAAR